MSCSSFVALFLLSSLNDPNTNFWVMYNKKGNIFQLSLYIFKNTSGWLSSYPTEEAEKIRNMEENNQLLIR